MATLKDYFDARTRSNAEWGYSSDANGIVTGFVVEAGELLEVSWIRDPSGNLFCQHGRAYDIQRRMPETAPVLRQIVERALDADFVIHATRDAHVFYTVQLTASLFLTGTDYAQVSLSVDGTEIAVAKNLLTMTLALGVTQTVTHQKVVSTLVPAGSTVRLTSTGTCSLIDTLEILL